MMMIIVLLVVNYFDPYYPDPFVVVPVLVERVVVDGLVSGDTFLVMSGDRR